MSRTPARLPEDVTALAERDSINKDRENNKNAVTKTYHTLKDLISGKFKKDNSDVADELNNVTTMQHDDYRSPYSALPPHMRQMQSLNQSQPNIYNTKSPLDHQSHQAAGQGSPRSYLSSDVSRGVQQRTLSQPQLASFERRDSQIMIPSDRRGSLDNMDVTDSDDGGFATKIIRTPQISYQLSNQKHQSLPGHNQRQSPQIFQNSGMNGIVTQQYIQTPYQHTHMPMPMSNNSPQMQQKEMMMYQHQQQENDKLTNPEQYSANLMHHSRQDAQRLSFQKQMHDNQQSQSNAQTVSNQPKSTPPPIQAKPNRKPDIRLTVPDQPHAFPHSGSGGSSDYDKSNSNVDSGRGSAAYSSGRKAPIENSPSPMRGVKSDDSEWVDIVDNELRNILEPGMQNLNIRPPSTVSGSVSSMSPPLPPLSPDGSSYKQSKVGVQLFFLTELSFAQIFFFKFL